MVDAVIARGLTTTSMPSVVTSDEYVVELIRVSARGGQVFHDAPSVLHYGEVGDGLELRAGMFFTIEPMINLGRYQVKILSDGWTAVTKDRSMSAQFEHSIAVTEDGSELFTVSPAGFHCPPYS